MKKRMLGMAVAASMMTFVGCGSAKLAENSGNDAGTYSDEMVIYQDYAQNSDEQIPNPEPTQQILDARPENGLVQIYDRILTMRLFLELPSVGQEGFVLPVGYMGSDPNSFKQNDTRIRWETVSQSIDQINEETSLELYVEDYNPEYLVAPDTDIYLRVKDFDGVTMYCIYAYNKGGETVPLANCQAIENLYSSGDPGIVYDKYAYFFGGINVFSGEWDYQSVSDELAKYDYERRENNTQGKLVVEMIVPDCAHIYTGRVSLMEGYLPVDEDVYLVYRFEFDAISSTLIHMGITKTR